MKYLMKFILITRVSLKTHNLKLNKVHSKFNSGSAPVLVMFARRIARRFFASASGEKTGSGGVINVQGRRDSILNETEAPPFLPQSSTFAYDYRPMSINPDTLGKTNTVGAFDFNFGR